MRVAVLSDIHGNLTALEAVLADLAREGVDQIVCLGDLAAKGPAPHEVVEQVKALGCITVRGNTDVSLLEPGLEAEVQGLHGPMRQIGEIFLWAREQLSPADRDYLAALPPTAVLQLDHGRSLLCFHGSPRSARDTILATTPDTELEPMFRGWTQEYLAGGHTHRQLFRRFNEAILLNPGSVGLPSTSSGEPRPLAEYAILSCEPRRASVELRQVPFDLERVLSLARERKLPHAGWWESNW